MVLNKRLKKLKEQVEKTGFPLELEIAEALYKDKWDVMGPGVNYYDKDELKYRELDIKAYKSYDCGESCIPGVKYRLTTSLIIQCKKSEKYSWIFFPKIEKEEVTIYMMDFLRIAKVQSIAPRISHIIRTTCYIHKISPELFREKPLINPSVAKCIKWLNDILDVKVEKFRIFKGKPQVYTGISLSFEGGKQYKDLYEASITVTKATIYELEEIISNIIWAELYLALSPEPWELESGIRPFLEIFVVLPIVVFDGLMCLYKRKSGDLRQVNHINYFFNCRTPNYFEKLVIHVISKDFFKEFIKVLDSDLQKLAQHIRKVTDELNEQVELMRRARYST